MSRPLSLRTIKVVTNLTVGDLPWKKHIIWASGHYMSNPYPSDYQEMSKDDFEEFIEDNVWEPFERLPVRELMELVEDLARSALKHFHDVDAPYRSL